MARSPAPDGREPQPGALSRRSFLKGAGGVTAGGLVGQGAAAAQQAQGPERASGTVEVLAGQEVELVLQAGQLPPGQLAQQVVAYLQSCGIIPHPG